MAHSPDTSTAEASLNREYMRLALSEAKKSPPKPTNFCVGAILVKHNPANITSETLETGYTLECPGNTHAEQCCFIKHAARFSKLSVTGVKDDPGSTSPEEELGHVLPEHTWLYTTMEPCNKRSVGNLPCVDRILAVKRKNGSQAIEKVLVGVMEPETFVGVNEGRKRLKDAGIEVVEVKGFEEEILEVAKAGHAEG